MRPFPFKVAPRLHHQCTRTYRLCILTPRKSENVHLSFFLGAPGCAAPLLASSSAASGTATGNPTVGLIQYLRGH